jgi:hypothetical protein
LRALALLAICLVTASFLIQAVAASDLTFNVVSVTFDKQSYYQGDSGIISLQVVNVNPFAVDTQRVFLRFQGLTNGAVLPAELKTHGNVWNSSSAPVLQSGQEFMFNISFPLYTFYAVGPQKYSVFWIGSESGVSTLSNITLISSSIQIGDRFQREYQQLLPVINARLTRVSTYQSPEAQSLLFKAIPNTHDVEKEAAIGNWQAAVVGLQEVSGILDQADAYEQSYLGQQQPTFQLGGIAAIVLMVVVLFVSVLAVWLLRQRALGRTSSAGFASA